MTLKNLKLSKTNKSSLENFNLWKELEDKTGEEIIGGATYTFENRINSDIPITLLNGSITRLTLEPFGQPGATQTVDLPENEITVAFDEILGEGISFVRKTTTPDGTGFFDLEEPNKIVFFPPASVFQPAFVPGV